MKKVAFIQTTDSITVLLNSVPYTFASGDRGFERVVDMVNKDCSEADIYAYVTEVQRELERGLALTPNMSYRDGVVLYKGTVIHNYAVTRLVDAIRSGSNFTPLARFLERLEGNPSKYIMDSLYSFLEKGNMPLTEDGCFLAYKAVRKDFKDIHSGTFDNSPGQTLTMRRNHVDDDPNRTCSTGLHVCSYNYLPHFANANGQVVLCKIDPADVVAIPSDYDDAKMRVCKYEVVGVVTDYYKRSEDILGNAGAQVGVMARDFSVNWETSGAADVHDTYYTPEEATQAAMELYKELIDDYHDDVSVHVVYAPRPNTPHKDGLPPGTIVFRMGV